MYHFAQMFLRRNAFDEDWACYIERLFLDTNIINHNAFWISFDRLYFLKNLKDKRYMQT